MGSSWKNRNYIIRGENGWTWTWVDKGLWFQIMCFFLKNNGKKEMGIFYWEIFSYRKWIEPVILGECII